MRNRNDNLSGFSAVVAIIVGAIAIARLAPQTGPSGSDSAEQITNDYRQRSQYHRPVSPTFGGTPTADRQP